MNEDKTCATCAHAKDHGDLICVNPLSEYCGGVVYEKGGYECWEDREDERD